MNELEHPSEMEFDRALLESASPGFAAHVEACVRCRDRLERLRGELAAFRAGDEPARAACIVADRLRPRRRWVWIPSVAGALAAAAFVFLLRPAPAIRTKGGPHIALFVRQTAGAPLRWDGAPLQEGDAVQLEVEPAGFPLATVFSVDDGCAVSLEHQQRVDGAGLIGASWTLRGRAGGERLYVVFSAQPVTSDGFAHALRRAAACDPGRAPDVETADFVARGAALRPGAAR
jgi:hypothetical protein